MHLQNSRSILWMLKWSAAGWCHRVMQRPTSKCYWTHDMLCALWVLANRSHSLHRCTSAWHRLPTRTLQFPCINYWLYFFCRHLFVRIVRKSAFGVCCFYRNLTRFFSDVWIKNCHAIWCCSSQLATRQRTTEKIKNLKNHRNFPYSSLSCSSRFFRFNQTKCWFFSVGLFILRHFDGI